MLSAPRTATRSPWRRCPRSHVSGRSGTRRARSRPAAARAGGREALPHGVFELGPPHGERLSPQVAAVAVQVSRRRRRRGGPSPAGGVETGRRDAGRRPRLLRRGAAVRSRSRPTASAISANVDVRSSPFRDRSVTRRSLLVREDAVPVVLLLVDPAGAVERLVDERREHGADAERDAVGRSLGRTEAEAEAEAARGERPWFRPWL